MNCKSPFKRFFWITLPLVLGICMTGCSFLGMPPKGGNGDGETGAEADNLPAVFDNDYDITENTLSISTDVVNGYTFEKGVCTICAAGIYSFSGSLANGQIVVNAADTDVVEIELKNVSIACDYGAPVLVLNADKVELSAKKDTKNVIFDKRTTCEETDETTAAIFSKSDFKLKGNGELSVKSALDNGINSKDDLDVKNLTLYVYAPNTAIKGNDSVSFENASVTAISLCGDAIKSSKSDVSTKGNQRGTISVNGGTLRLYACCDGIDAAYDVILSADADIAVYTNTYSSYSTEAVEKSQSTLYFRFTANNMGGMRPGQSSSFQYSAYQYSVLFTLTDGSEVWKNLSSPKTAGSYVFYPLQLPENAVKFCLYAYTSSQTLQSKDAFAYYTGDKNMNASYDTFYINGVSGNKLSGGWTNYSTSTQQGPGGGMNEGNPDSADFSCKGIKADNTITVENSTVEIYAYDDALHANNDIPLDNGNYGQGNITIHSGTLTLTSKDDAIHADQDFFGNGGTVTVKTSYEGIEANRVYFKGITAYLYSLDDGINAAASGLYTPLVQISAGYVDAEVPSGDTDTMDSNGTIEITGGVVILKNGQGGSSQTGGTIDCDGSVYVSGGTVIAIGAVCNKISGSKQSTTASLNAGNYTFKNANGNTIATFTLNNSHKGYMIYTASGTYTLYCDNSSILSLTF